MSDARERWREQHRRQRLRAPKVSAARNAAAWPVLALTVGFALLGLFVAWGWAIGAFVAFYLFLRLKGVRPGGDPSGVTSDVHVD